MKRFLQNLFAGRAAYTLALLVLSITHEPAAAQFMGPPMDVCGVLEQHYCRILAVDNEEGWTDYYFLENYGSFDIGDHVRVIGTFYNPGPSPCYVADNGIIENCIFWCDSTIYIKPDGSGDYPTIQAGINAAADGYTVVLANGIFSGSGNRDIFYYGKTITVRSCSGDPDSCIIDCGGTVGDQHTGFYFHNGEGPGSVLQGVTVKNGYTNYWEFPWGGGIDCRGGSPSFIDCAFKDNVAVYGGGMFCNGDSPTLINCTFSGNSASAGGGMYCYAGSSPTLTNCTFADNSATIGGGMYSLSSIVTLENTIFAFNALGEGVFCDGMSSVTITCCDIYGNAGGDWVGCIAGQNGINGNFSADPLFCGQSGSGDYFLQSASPCAPSNSPCGSLIGALPVGCGDVSWLVLCPRDATIPVYTNISTLVLDGFVITNIDNVDLAFSYCLTSEGPATLVDNSDPTSLSGTTPLLSPGESFSPPDAALDIPTIREYSQQFVTYYVSAIGHPEITDSCTTVVTFEPPVAVKVANFEGRVVETGVELVWEVVTDEEVRGFKIHRSVPGEKAGKPIHAGALIPRHAKRYIDSDVQSGRAYLYTLSVVRADGSEVRSQILEIKTSAGVLALHQNHPNPFNPTTTISFTLPESVHARLSVFNLEGKLIVTLVDGLVGEGFGEVTWDGKDTRGNPASTGVYFYRLRAGKDVLTKKMVLLK